jgi:hypothetical protein
MQQQKKDLPLLYIGDEEMTLGTGGHGKQVEAARRRSLM